MLTYATAQDLVDRFDAQELAQLAVPKEHVSIDAVLLKLTITADDRSAYSQDDIIAADAALVKINRALSDASGEIDAHISGRYQLPLSTVPDIVKIKCSDIARFLLFDDHPNDHVAKRYDDAVTYLKNVSTGKVSLGIDDTHGVPKTNDTVQFNGGSNVFDRDSAKDFI